jgi:hypothetical protein
MDLGPPRAAQIAVSAHPTQQQAITNQGRIVMDKQGKATSVLGPIPAQRCELR